MQLEHVRIYLTEGGALLDAWGLLVLGGVFFAGRELVRRIRTPSIH